MEEIGGQQMPGCPGRERGALEMPQQKVAPTTPEQERRQGFCNEEPARPGYRDYSITP